MPDFVAVITVRLSCFSAGIAPPLALVISTTSCRPAGILFISAASSAPEISGPGKLNLYSVPSKVPCPIIISTKASGRFGLRSDATQRRFHLRLGGIRALQRLDHAIRLAAGAQNLVRCRSPAW